MNMQNLNPPIRYASDSHPTTRIVLEWIGLRSCSQFPCIILISLGPQLEDFHALPLIGAQRALLDQVRENFSGVGVPKCHPRNTAPVFRYAGHDRGRSNWILHSRSMKSLMQATAVLDMCGKYII